MMRKQIGISLGLMVLIFWGCNHQPSEKNTSAPAQPGLKYPYSYVQQLGPQIDYALSEKDDKAKEIRVWINEELTEPEMLVEIKALDSIVYIKKMLFTYSRDNNRNYTLDSLTLSNKIVPLRMDAIFQQLNALGFETVQSQSDSLKQMIGDGTTYVIEVKQNSSYKIINANSPHFFKDDNSKKLMAILNYLSKVAGFSL